MPDEYNFTTPAVGGQNNGHQGGATRGQGDQGQVWNPTGGPNGTGAWETPGQHEQFQTFNSQGWAGRGEDVDGNGNFVPGTSGMQRDVDRYKTMQAPVNPNGPVIDQTRGNESRDIGMGALGLLRQTAEGRVPSAAERLGTQQGLDAQNARLGVAASVRGGAAARAAANRNAVADSGTIGQQTLASNAATRAGEMATARGAYFGASTAQRGTDLGVATDQGNLDAGQRTANDQRDAFYAGKAHDVQKAELGAQLHRTAAENAAADTGRQTDLAMQERSAARQAQAANTIVGGATGAAQAYQKSEMGKPAPAAENPKPDPDVDTSDERAKDNVKPVTNRVAQNLKSRARAMQDNTAMLRDAHGLPPAKDPLKEPPRPEPAGKSLVDDVEAARRKKRAEEMRQPLTEAFRSSVGLGTTNTPGNESAARGEVEEAPKGDFKPFRVTHDDGRTMMVTERGQDFDSPKGRLKARTRDIERGDPYDDRPKATWGTGERAGGSDELQEAMRKSVEKDAGPPERKMNPENPYTNSLFGHAEPGHARSRAGQPGGMFGVDGASADEAPGTSDFRAGNHKVKDPYSRQIMGENTNKGFRRPPAEDVTFSDARAKREAFIDGVNHTQQMQDTGKVPTPPSYMPNSPPGRNVRMLEVEQVSTGSQKKPQAPAPTARKPAPDRQVSDAEAKRLIAQHRAAPPIEVSDEDAARLLAAQQEVAISDERAKGDISDLPKKFFGGRSTEVHIGSAVGASNTKDAKDREDAKRHMSEQDQAREAKRWVEGNANRSGQEISFSDERAKNVHDGDPMADANRSMEPKVYNYKEGFAEMEGQTPDDVNVGPIAQKMKADPVASTAIVEDDQSGMLGIDKSKGLKLVMGGLADLQRQVDDINKRKGARA